MIILTWSNFGISSGRRTMKEPPGPITRRSPFVSKSQESNSITRLILPPADSMAHLSQSLHQESARARLGSLSISFEIYTLHTYCMQYRSLANNSLSQILPQVETNNGDH